MRIVADDRIPFLKGVFEPFSNIDYIAGDKILKSDLLNAVVLITRSITQCNSELLDGTSIKFIATATIGDDHIDKEFCRKNNIKVVSAKGCNAMAVVQYVTAALLSIENKKNLNLKQMVIGIIGVGNIGSKIKNIAEILGMKVILNDPPRAEREKDENFVDLDTLLKSADIITLHVPLTSKCIHPTFHMADNMFFEKAKKPGIFINTSRGEVVDETALKSSIKNGSIKSAIIDVWEKEPEIDCSLLEFIDICTPHIAGYSLEGKVNATSMVVNAINEFFDLEIKFLHPEICDQKKLIEFNCTDLSHQETLLKAVSKTYDIMKDDKMFRSSPQDFQNHRNNYKFRREFGAYELKLINCPKDIGEKLLNLGIKTL